MVTAYVTETGVLESPGFPDNYPSNMWCRWTLVAELDCDIVKVNFTHIILEEKYDKLTVCPKNVCSEGEKIVLTGIASFTYIPFVYLRAGVHTCETAATIHVFFTIMLVQVIITHLTVYWSLRDRT